MAEGFFLPPTARTQAGKDLRVYCEHLAMSDKYTETYAGKKIHNTSGVSYHPAKYFLNDLDNENDYYLEVRQSGENTFVKKDKVDKKNKA